MTYWALIIGHQTISPSQSPRGDWSASRWSTARSRATPMSTASGRTGRRRDGGRRARCWVRRLRQVLLPLPDGELLEETDGRIQLRDRLVEVGLPRGLLRLDGDTVLAQERPDEDPVRDAEHEAQQPRGDAQRQQRNLERLEVEEEKGPCRPLVDGEEEAPVLILPSVFDHWYGYS